MQQPSFFENEIVQPKNLNFLNDSTSKNIKDIVVAIGGGQSGKVAGLTLSGVSGNNYFVVNPGYGFTGDGERVQIYSTGINFGIAFTGTQSVYLNFASAVWNPDPTVNPLGASFVVTNVDPTDDSLVAVENFNLAQILLTSGSSYIPLGTVTADSSMLFVTSSPSGSRDFTLGGVIDVNSNTINGINISSGSIDSNIFTSELHYNVNLSTGVSLNMTSSGSSNIASKNNPLANIYALTGTFHQINGMSPILIDTMQQVSGTSLEATGTNLVQIDTQAQGTRFGNGMTIRTNSISTVGTNNDINITTNPLQRVNINSTVNIAAGNNLFVKDNLFVSGTANFGSTNIASITGNLAVQGTLTFNNTPQQFNNLVPNPDFSQGGAGSPGGTGVGFAPAIWTSATLNTAYAYGPVPAGTPNQTLTAPAAFITALNNTLHITGNYTVEMNVNINGPSSYTSPQNSLFYKQNGVSANFNGNLLVTAASGLRFDSNAISLVSPTGVIRSKQWYNVAYTWNNAQRKIYIDGTLVGSDSVDGAWHDGSTNFWLGAFQPNQNLINGMINNVRVSNIARTSFPSGSAHVGVDFNTLAFWSLNNTLADSTPSNFTLLTNNLPSPAPFTDTRLGQVFSGTINIAANDNLPAGSQNSFYGAPHTNTWLLCSGTNIDSTGTFLSAPVSLKPNTTYNLSYYAKSISNSGTLGIINYVFGLTQTGTYIQTPVSAIPTTINGSEWTRVNTVVTTPVSGSNFNFGLAIRNTQATGTANQIFGLTAAQATEGLALTPHTDQGAIFSSIKKALPTSWGSYEGSTGVLYDSYNVASIVRLAVGRYQINFINPMVNTNYTVVIGGASFGVVNQSWQNMWNYGNADRQLTSMTIGSIGDAPAGALTDRFLCFAIYGGN